MQDAEKGGSRLRHLVHAPIDMQSCNNAIMRSMLVRLAGSLNCRAFVCKSQVYTGTTVLISSKSPAIPVTVLSALR